MQHEQTRSAKFRPGELVFRWRGEEIRHTLNKNRRKFQETPEAWWHGRGFHSDLMWFKDVQCSPGVAKNRGSIGPSSLGGDQVRLPDGQHLLTTWWTRSNQKWLTEHWTKSNGFATGQLIGFAVATFAMWQSLGCLRPWHTSTTYVL